MSYLNDKLENFEYFGVDRNNRPVKIVQDSSSKISIKQTATQMLCMLRLLPLIIGDKFPEDDGQ